jgi:membrane-associated phospholipid phosphatase
MSGAWGGLRLWAEETRLRIADFWGATARPRATGCRIFCAQAARTRRHPLIWGTIYVALFCPFSMAVIDRPLALALKAGVGGNIEGFFQTVTNLGRAGLYLVPAALLTLFFWLEARGTIHPDGARRWRDRAWRSGFLVLSMAGSGIVENIVKVCVGRYRPRLLFEKGLYGFHPFDFHWAMNSFPSGHSQAAWAAMSALVVLVPRYDLMWLAIATLVAVSRVVITVHYLSDVVAGAWLGVVGTVLLARYLAKRGIRLSP